MTTFSDHYSPEALAKVMGLDDSAAGVWGPSDYPELVRHQLASPLREELAGYFPARRAEIERFAAQCALTDLTDLLQHSRPPVQLLELAKRFFKDQTAARPALLPPDLAYAFYYAVIAVGIQRLGRWFSRLDDAELRQGLQWSLSQPWLGDALHQIIQDGLTHLDRRGDV
jgi:hypothetical protein